MFFYVCKSAQKGWVISPFPFVVELGKTRGEMEVEEEKVKEWTLQIRERVLAYEQRREEIRTAAVELISELNSAVPDAKWEFKSDRPICITVAINKTIDNFTEAEIWEAQKIYEFDEVGNPITSGKTTVKEALIKLILDRFRWTAEQ